MQKNLTKKGKIAREMAHHLPEIKQNVHALRQQALEHRFPIRDTRYTYMVHVHLPLASSRFLLPFPHFHPLFFSVFHPYPPPPFVPLFFHPPGPSSFHRYLQFTALWNEWKRATIVPRRPIKIVPRSSV